MYEWNVVDHPPVLTCYEGPKNDPLIKVKTNPNPQMNSEIISQLYCKGFIEYNGGHCQLDLTLSSKAGNRHINIVIWLDDHPKIVW